MICWTLHRPKDFHCECYSVSQRVFSYLRHISKIETETSSSLLDILLVSNNSHLIVSGVANPFLNHEHRYHCPIFGIYNFSKPKSKSFTRHIWKYDQGDYNLLRNKAASTDWVSLEDNDINTNAKNVTDYIQSISKLCIPNKNIKVRPSDPPWITTFIKRYIRKRKRAYRKAKQTNLRYHWDKFRKLRNKIVSLIKESKRTCDENIAKKLKSDSLTSTDWWSTLKTVISPSHIWKAMDVYILMSKTRLIYLIIF